MAILFGAATSAAMRYLLSVNFRSYGVTNRQAVVFNILDMTISSLVCFWLKEKGRSEKAQLFLGRGIGFIASATIASITVGPINLIAALAISGISQFTGLCAYWMMKGKGRLGTIV